MSIICANKDTVNVLLHLQLKLSSILLTQYYIEYVYEHCCPGYIDKHVTKNGKMSITLVFRLIKILLTVQISMHFECCLLVEKIRLIFLLSHSLIRIMDMTFSNQVQEKNETICVHTHRVRDGFSLAIHQYPYQIHVYTFVILRFPSFISIRTEKLFLYVYESFVYINIVHSLSIHCTLID